MSTVDVSTVDVSTVDVSTVDVSTIDVSTVVPAPGVGAATPAATARRRSPAGVLGDLLLWIASVGGLVCIIGVIAAVVFHVTLIMFKTGSMEPTIPTGSLAIVHEIPASEIRVGDIVTVERVGQLPVTHRVTSVDGSGDTRTITLRGDANPTDDIEPYLVSTVRIAWIWFPGWASVVVWFSNPVVLGSLTVGATCLVTWAFWPREDGRRGPHGRRRAPRRRPSGSAESSSGVGAGAATAVTLFLAVALVAGAAPDAARAADVVTVVSGTYLTLTSISDPDQLVSMTPGNPVDWQVGIDATAPEPGDVHLGLAGVAPLPPSGQFTLEVQACATQWVAGACGTGSTVWLPTTDLTTAVTPTTSFGAREVGSMDSADVRWLMMTVTLTTPGASPLAQLRFWAWGAGRPLSTGPAGLANTGAAAGSWFPPAMLAAVALGSGLLLATIAGRRRARRDG